MNPNGSVTCAGGRCDNGQSCNGVGNICGCRHLPDGGIIDVNASQNCCDGRKDVCKVDSARRAALLRRRQPAVPLGLHRHRAVLHQRWAATASSRISAATGACACPRRDGTLSCQRPTCKPVGSECTPGTARRAAARAPSVWPWASSATRARCRAAPRAAAWTAARVAARTAVRVRRTRARSAGRMRRRAARAPSAARASAPAACARRPRCASRRTGLARRVRTAARA